MESEVLIETGQINDEFTLLSLFFRADIVVKLVILILFAASILSWTIIIQKIRLFKSLKQFSQNFEDEFWSGRSIKEISRQVSAPKKLLIGSWALLKRFQDRFSK